MIFLTIEVTKHATDLYLEPTKLPTYVLNITFKHIKLSLVALIPKHMANERGEKNIGRVEDREMGRREKTLIASRGIN